MLWDKASLEELPRLKAIDLSKMPKLRRISSELSDQNGLVGRLKSISLNSCKAIESLISELPPNEDFVFSNLQKLMLHDQEYFKCIFHQSLRVKFKALHELKLKELYLGDVPGKQEKSSNQVGGEIERQQDNGISMVNVSLFFEKVEFALLEKLTLYGSTTSDESYGASNSTMIRLEYLPLTMLQNLTSLRLMDLDMRCFFPTKSILLALRKLEELWVVGWRSLEDFFGGVDHEEDHQHGATDRLQLSSLRILRLETLPKLKQLSCQIFPDLQELDVWCCDKFHIPVYITKRDTTGELSKLQKLSVKECNGMEAIFGGKEKTQGEDHEEESTNDVVQYAMEFSSLESIEIYKMCFLRTIFNTSAAGGCSYDVQLPSLLSVKINECLNMESFSSGTPIAPKLTSIEINGEQIDVEDCTAGDLNSVVQRQFNKRQKVVSDWPKKIKYREHNQHELMLVILPTYKKCNACRSVTSLFPRREFGFGCGECDFYICGRCGLESILESNGKDRSDEVPNLIKMAMKWPKTLNHELHHHELNLQAVTNEVPTWCLNPKLWLSDVKPKKDYCRICQGEISDIFAYSCKNQSCNFSLHRKCALGEEHQVTEMSSGIADGNRGPPDSVPAQPVELAIPELSPLPELSDSRTSVVPTSPSETSATQEIVSNVPLATTDGFNAKITAAEQAFSSWQNTSIVAGQHITLKLLELIMRDTDKIAFKITIEQEKFLKETLGELYSGIEMEGQVSEMSTFQTEEIVLSGSREPISANCVEISTANLPSTVLLWIILVAITCGNTFVLKSSQISPDTLAERTYIRWPTSLVTFETKESFVGSKVNVNGKRIEVDPNMIVKEPTEVYPLVDESTVDCFTNDTEELHFILSNYLPENCSFLIKLPNSVFLFGEDRETWMLRDDFVHFFKYECLNISIIHVFLLYVMDKCGEYGFTHISCLCPEAISKSRMSIVSTREQCFTYLSNGVETCLKLDKRLIFLPYHEGYHWRLLVVCLPKNIVHVFDPANDKINKDISISKDF